MYLSKCDCGFCKKQNEEKLTKAKNNLREHIKGLFAKRPLTDEILNKLKFLYTYFHQYCE